MNSPRRSWCDGPEADCRVAKLHRCKRSGIEPFAWFGDLLSRIPAHSITRMSELLPTTGSQWPARLKPKLRKPAVLPIRHLFA